MNTPLPMRTERAAAPRRPAARGEDAPSRIGPDPPQWVALERLLLSVNEGLGEPYRDDLPSAHTVNPILKATRAAWRRAHRLLGVHPLLHAQAPLWLNTGLRIGGDVLNWPQWKRASIHYTFSDPRKRHA
ncbi:hypothetical protein NDU88_004269 [Pleurodeles waltl]|uniref:Uncharacterized protein n=1 Tax=Pleurodeles waltl TaxID=8319 RepID=A0AAV7SIF5_PLEWA|nr:hypothetical protein NDU88_004269 [Pleurodeles waltl]